eukprot:m.49122 g.49122  ORF g.49122 m.49122 type:complete len:181 (+) comp10598_c0_seq4:553-1095(+)
MSFFVFYIFIYLFATFTNMFLRFTWENEGGTSWTKYFSHGVPSELDIISIDDYYLNVSEHRKFYEQEIYPLLNENQKVFLVPGAFATRITINTSQWCTKPDGTPGQTMQDCDRFMVNLTKEYYQWALEDQRVVGFAPWHWDTRGADEVSRSKEVGVEDMPLTKAQWKLIGDDIRRGSFTT